VGTILSNTINVIDTKTNKIVNTIASDSPNGMAFSADFRSLFVTNVFAGTVQEISLETRMVVKTEAAGDIPGYLVLTQDGKRGYFVRPAGNTVDVLDTTTLKIIDTITVDTGPNVVTTCRH
jgi:DNA-binding beta-propeller fold protein YncE